MLDLQRIAEEWLCLNELVPILRKHVAMWGCMSSISGTTSPACSTRRPAEQRCLRRCAGQAISLPSAGLIYPEVRIEELFRIFETGQVGVVVDNNKIVGIVSKIDVLDFMSRRK